LEGRRKGEGLLDARFEVRLHVSKPHSYATALPFALRSELVKLRGVFDDRLVRGGNRVEGHLLAP
jgi:hypothetical protein